jgi:hypothetical protein
MQANTIHSSLSIYPEGGSYQTGLFRFAYAKKEELKSVQVLIIDEISMVEVAMLDFVSTNLYSENSKETAYLLVGCMLFLSATFCNYHRSRENKSGTRPYGLYFTRSSLKNRSARETAAFLMC